MEHARPLTLLFVLLLLVLSPATEAFRFTVTPGKIKCFTSDIAQTGRYEFRYQMARSLSPFVSVSITSPGGRVLLEHEPAKERTREVLSIKRTGNIGICFNVAPKAASATALNITLNVEDAEDAERTRTTKASYSRTSPVSIGAIKGSGAYRQMKYITKTLIGIRRTYTGLSDDDNGIRYSIIEAESNTWMVSYLFVAIAVVTNVVNFVRLRRVMKRFRML